MNIREFNQRFLEPGSQWAMVLGIIFLCQPWFEVLHEYSVTLMLIGIIAFNIAVHIPKPVKKADVDDTGPVPVSQVVRGGSGHG
jgi:hypothetical protein